MQSNKKSLSSVIVLIFCFILITGIMFHSNSTLATGEDDFFYDDDFGDDGFNDDFGTDNSGDFTADDGFSDDFSDSYSNDVVGGKNGLPDSDLSVTHMQIMAGIVLVGLSIFAVRRYNKHLQNIED